ncbi:CBS domain-containing protein [Salinicoccus halitifaciens]|uniref:CBS domain-containing protein n=1 Tax=Salinicoccus halitifaciens TaxID=1073415 RepID=A0ABV2E7S7_9STAP|nr:CBS domain-containing protein [Salinicoccus halitifaciens]MCD2136459.1 CBS domain-containing protein [Salinicoccus halitifaciens]
MKVTEIMTTDVETVSPEATIEQVASMMKDLDVGAIPVVGNDGLRGIVTDRDLVIRGIASQFPLDTPVGRIISTSTATGSKDMDVEEAAEIMRSAQIRRLPILEDDRVVGMVSLGDIAVKQDDPEDSEVALEEISRPAEPDR